MREAAKRSISFAVAAEALNMSADCFRYLAQQGKIPEVVRVYVTPSGRHGYWVIPEKLAEITKIPLEELRRRNIEYKEHREALRHRGKEVL